MSPPGTAATEISVGSNTSKFNNILEQDLFLYRLSLMLSTGKFGGNPMKLNQCQCHQTPHPSSGRILDDFREACLNLLVGALGIRALTNLGSDCALGISPLGESPSPPEKFWSSQIPVATRSRFPVNKQARATSWTSLLD